MRETFRLQSLLKEFFPGSDNRVVKCSDAQLKQTLRWKISAVHSRKLGKTFLKDSVQNGGRPTRKRIKIISPPWKIAIIRLRIPLYAARNCRPSSHWMNIKPGFLKIPVLPHNKQTLSRMLKHCSACFEFHLGSGLIFSSIWLSPSLPPTLLAPRHSPFPFLSPARTFSWSTLGHSYFGTININYQHSASCWR